MNNYVIKEINKQISTIVSANYYQLAAMKDMDYEYLQKAIDLFIIFVNREIVLRTRKKYDNFAESEFVVNIEDNYGRFQAGLSVNLDAKYYRFTVRDNKYPLGRGKLIISQKDDVWTLDYSKA